MRMRMTHRPTPPGNKFYNILSSHGVVEWCFADWVGDGKLDNLF
jgi:hypothetical protein